MSQQITEHDFFKSLSRLEALAKGSEPEATDDKVEKAQICTGSGNEPQSWPGGDKDKLGDNWDDSIGKDGTDYKAGGKARKSIAEKVAKGQPLTPEEISVISGDIDRAQSESVSKAVPPIVEDEDKKDDKDKPLPIPEEKGKEKEEEVLPVAKSFAEAVQENETVQKGIEVSDFLLELTKSFAAGLQGLEQRVTKAVVDHIRGDIGTFAKEQGEFNKSLADAVVNIGHGLTGVTKSQEAAGNAPAGPPKTQLRSNVQVLQKSQEAPTENLSKSQILSAMTDLVEKGQCSPLDVIKYEATGDLAPHLQEQVKKSIGQ